MEAVLNGSRESDPSIVVGDGNAAHKAKGWAGEQRWQSTHVGATNAPRQSVSRSLPVQRRMAVMGPKRFRLRQILCTRSLDEPGAGIPHAGISEGAAGQPAVLP